jgi:signal transduction histidine kinase
MDDSIAGVSSEAKQEPELDLGKFSFDGTTARLNSSKFEFARVRPRTQDRAIEGQERFEIDEEPMQEDESSQASGYLHVVLGAAAVAALVAAILLAVALALTWTNSAKPSSVYWLIWVQAGLMVLGLGLGLVAWIAHRAEDQSVVRVAQQVNQALTAQSRRLGVFREIAAAGGQSLDLREVLELGLEKVLQVTGQEAAEIHLLDPDGCTMATRASFGGPEGFLIREEPLVVGECLCGLAVLNDELVLVPDTENDPRVTRLSCHRFGFRSAACVPLRVKGRVVGVLAVHGREKRHFGAGDTELLVTVADQLTTAIENARLYADMEARVEALSRELQYMAVVEERERLSREVHDGLAQTLSLLSMQVGQARSLLLSGDVDGIAAELREMSQVIDAGYEEVREAITNLRLAAPKGADWADWLQGYVYEFGLRHDLSIELRILYDSLTPSDGVGEAPLIFPPHQEVHLTRLIQEALNNVRKHAQASHVQMALILDGRKVTLRIEDDGRGFDVDRAQGRRGRYGLSTMRERAELLGGNLRIASVPGRGTTITVEIESEVPAEG